MPAKAVQADKLKHEPVPEDLSFRRTAHEERHLLETVQVPIVTVSATFKEELEAIFGEEVEDTPDVTFSRAHYSMANAVLVAATKKKKTFWMIDPTNYVSAKDWPKIMFTQRMGRLIARNPILKDLKDMLDTRLRNQLPLTAAIREPLSYVTARIKKPIISLHYEAGNILLESGHRVLQVVTDPHVRPQYLTHAKNLNLTWAVFDDKTKAELLELAYILGQQVDEKRVYVTGCPVDPRIPVRDRNKSTTAFKKRPLRLAVTTGGLGQNKDEIKEILHHLTPCLKKNRAQLVAYAGVHNDFYQMFEDYAKEHSLKIGKPEDSQASFRILKGNDIIDANELLLDYVFPWADCFITKPSGDMAYEAVTAGCFLMTLKPWGEWEENIRQYFEELGVSVRARPEDIVKQFEALRHVPVSKGKPWIELALEKSRKLQIPLSRGAFNILRLHQQLSKKS